MTGPPVARSVWLVLAEVAESRLNTLRLAAPKLGDDGALSLIGAEKAADFGLCTAGPGPNLSCLLEQTGA